MENKLKEALKKLGIETAEQLNAAIKAEKPLDIGIMTSEVAKEQKSSIIRRKTMKLFKKHTAGMKQYKEFKKCIGMIGKIEESADAKEAALTAGYIIGVVKERHDKRLITDSMFEALKELTDIMLQDVDERMNSDTPYVMQIEA